MFEHILRFNARLRPGALAISTPVGDASFATLDRDVDRMAAGLRERAASGSLVAVQAANPGLHWVVLMALARLGCATASLPVVGERSEAELLAVIAPDLLVTDRDVPRETTSAFHMSREWIEEIFKASVGPCPVYDFAPDEPVRVVLSSGTTGHPKKMTLTRELLDTRLQVLALTHLAGKRLHVAVGLDVEIAFRSALVAWATYACVVYPEVGFSWSEFLLKSRPQSLMLTPFQLDALLRSLPADFPRQSMDVIVISGAVPPHLYARARARLSPEIYVTYGSTEAGYVATSAPGGAGLPNVAGLVCPHAQVEIVDAHDARQGAGGQGRLRIRSPELVDGYAEAADTRAHFKDGWFYPGDLGSLAADGALTLDGRETEVFDIGGLRIAPSAIEEVLLACEGVRDAAAFAVRIEGADWPHAAVVCQPGCDLAAVEARLAQERPQLQALLVVVDEIPRSGRGKPRRDLLARQFGAGVDAPRSSGESASEETA